MPLPGGAAKAKGVAGQWVGWEPAGWPCCLKEAGGGEEALPIFWDHADSSPAPARALAHPVGPPPPLSFVTIVPPFVLMAWVFLLLLQSSVCP